MPKDGQDSGKAQQAPASAIPRKPTGQEQSSSTSSEAMSAMLSQIDQTRSFYERKAAELQKKLEELSSRESEIERRKTELDSRESMMIKRAEYFSSLETQTKELAEQLEEARKGQGRKAGESITQPLVDLENLQRRYEDTLKQVRENAKRDKEEAVAMTESMYIEQLEQAQATIRDLQGTIQQKPPEPVDDLETTLQGIPSPVREEEENGNERPTKKPGLRKSSSTMEGMPTAKALGQEGTEEDGAEQLYQKLAEKATAETAAKERGRGERLLKSLQKRGVATQDAIQIVHEALHDYVIYGKIYDDIIEKGKETDKLLNQMQEEKLALDRRKEELSGLELTMQELDRQKEDLETLSTALDMKERKLLEQQGKLKDVKEILTEGRKYFQTLNRAVRELVLDCHNTINEYQGRVESLVDGPRNIGAEGVVLELLPAYAMNLLKEPQDPALSGMIENKDRPTIYFTAGDVTETNKAARLASQVPEDTTYITGRSEDGTYFVAAKGRSEGGTAIANFAAWGIPADDDGNISEDTQRNLERTAYSIMVKAVLPDHRRLHSYTVRWPEIARSMEKIEESIKKD